MMGMDEIKKGSEVLKNSSEALKNFQSIIESIFQPRGINLAISEGYKKIIEKYIDREDVDEYTKTAFLSSYKKTIKEFKNCTTVSNIAMSLISEDAKPQDVEEDWFAFFFDKVRLVSDESFQRMWGQVLANEVNNPGRFSKSLVHTLSIMSTYQAKLFCALSKFCMYEYRGNEVLPLIFMSTDSGVYEDLNISVHDLRGLENLGLIQCDFKGEFVFHKKKRLRYGNQLLEIFGNPQNHGNINAGNVQFTYDGRTLFDIVDDSYKQYQSDILDFTITKFQYRNCTVYLNGKLVI